MQKSDLQPNCLKHRLLACVALAAMASNAMAPIAMASEADTTTLTPIKHVIIIIGENRTFDHIFATYKPVNKGAAVLNLLSQGIVKADGSPGDHYRAALQYKAFNFKRYNLTPAKTPYLVLPPGFGWRREARRRQKRSASGVRGHRPHAHLHGHFMPQRRQFGNRQVRRKWFGPRLLSVHADRRHRPNQQHAGQTRLL